MQNTRRKTGKTSDSVPIGDQFQGLWLGERKRLLQSQLEFEIESYLALDDLASLSLASKALTAQVARFAKQAKNIHLCYSSLLENAHRAATTIVLHCERLQVLVIDGFFPFHTQWKHTMKWLLTVITRNKDTLRAVDVDEHFILPHTVQVAMLQCANLQRFHAQGHSIHIGSMDAIEPGLGLLASHVPVEGLASGVVSQGKHVKFIVFVNCDLYAESLTELRLRSGYVPQGSPQRMGYFEFSLGSLRKLSLAFVREPFQYVERMATTLAHLPCLHTFDLSVRCFKRLQSSVSWSMPSVTSLSIRCDSDDAPDGALPTIKAPVLQELLISPVHHTPLLLLFTQLCSGAQALKSCACISRGNSSFHIPEEAELVLKQLEEGHWPDLHTLRLPAWRLRSGGFFAVDTSGRRPLLKLRHLELSTSVWYDVRDILRNQPLLETANFFGMSTSCWSHGIVEESYRQPFDTSLQQLYLTLISGRLFEKVRFPQLRSLTLDRCDLHTEYLDALFASCPVLRSLSMTDTSITPIPNQAWSYERFPERKPPTTLWPLHELQLSDMSNSFDAAYELLAHFPQLRVLGLDWTTGFQQLADVLDADTDKKLLPVLEELRLGQVQPKQLCKILTRLPTVRKLQLRMNFPASWESLEAFKQWLQPVRPHILVSILIQ